MRFVQFLHDQFAPRRGHAPARLGFQVLEDRCNPANYYWEPVNSFSAADPENWMKGPGVPWARYEATDPAPGPTSDLYFLGGVSSEPCLIPAALTADTGNAFASLHLKFSNAPEPEDEEELPGDGEPPPPPSPPTYPLLGYWGTVTTADSFAVGALDMDCGYISQGSSTVTSGNGSTLTITSGLSWTGGTLNSNSVAGFINLAPGATGVAEPSFTNPGIDGKVYAGSPIQLRSDELTQVGSSLDIDEGEYNFTAHANLMVFGHSELKINAPVPKLAAPPGKVKLKQDNVVTDYTKDVKNGVMIDTKPESLVTIDTGGRRGNINTTAAPVEFIANKPSLVNHGELVISDLVNVNFKPTEGSDGDGGGILQQQFALGNGFFAGLPRTSIEAGSSILCEGKTKVLIKGLSELILTERVVNNVTLEDQPKVTISAPGADKALHIGPSATFKHQNGGTATIPVEIKGLFQCDGGVELGAVRNKSVSDTISVTKQVVFGANADLTVKWLSDAGSAWGHSWLLIESDHIDATGNDPAINKLPGFFPPDPNAADVPEVYLSPNSKQLFMTRALQ